MRKLMAYVLLLLSFAMHGQTCCSGGVPLSSNLGMANEGRSSWVISLSYDYNNLNTLQVGKDELKDFSRERLTHSVLLGIGYGFTDRLSLETLLSWVNQTRTISQFGNENFTETRGFGDTVLLLKYAFPDLFKNSSALSLGLGMKAPTGEANLTNEEGILLNADLQPGSGAWDGLVWMAINTPVNFRPNAMVIGSFIYRLTGKNDQYLNRTATYEFGDEVQVQTGYIDEFYLLNTILYPGLILKYRRVDADRIDSQLIPNTGGEWFFLRPEINLMIIPNFELNLRAEMPVYSFVEGTQLTPTYRIAFGLTYVFRKNVNKLNIIQ